MKRLEVAGSRLFGREKLCKYCRRPLRDEDPVIKGFCRSCVKHG